MNWSLAPPSGAVKRQVAAHRVWCVQHVVGSPLPARSQAVGGPVLAAGRLGGAIHRPEGEQQPDCVWAGGGGRLPLVRLRPLRLRLQRHLLLSRHLT